MRRRRNKGESCRGKALDLWQPPNGAGEPLFCLATTFTFDAVFFETECLGRFLQMDTHPEEDDSIGYLIEREEKLASARVCVLVDRRHAQARESLRWDLLPVFVPNAVQHAKLSILCWADHVRAIIGSGNLTEPGYRKNLEIFGTLDASRKEGGAISEILASIEFLEQMVELTLGDDTRQGPKQRVRETIDLLRAHIQNWPRSVQRGMRVIPIFSGLGVSVLEELRETWPASGPPRIAHVLSPFFDRGASAASTTAALAEILAKRGERFINFYIPYEDLSDGRTRLFAPRALVDSARETCDIDVSKVPLKQDDENRPLHAKIMVLENDDWEVWLIGSSNFTRAGLGLSDSAVNFEANLAYIVRIGEPEYKTLQEAAWLEIDEEDIDPDSDAIVWEPAINGEDESETVVGLPAAFREALYDASRKRLVLLLEYKLPQFWCIKADNNEELLNSDSWSGDVGEQVISWDGRPVPLVLQVEWESRSGRHAAGWPVNILDPGLLPPPEVLRNLSLEELVEILGSPQPLYRAIIQTLKRRSLRPSSDIQLDPHKRVNTEAFLLKRTRRVSLALERLRERLERPISNIDALEWRLRGPVGPLALARAFQKEACTSGEARFFLAELALMLKRARIKVVAGDISERARERILASILEIESLAGVSGGSNDSAIDHYIERAFLEAKQ